MVMIHENQILMMTRSLSDLSLPFAVYYLLFGVVSLYAIIPHDLGISAIFGQVVSEEKMFF